MQIKTSGAIAKISESLKVVDAAKVRIMNVDGLRGRVELLYDKASSEDTPDDVAELAAKEMVVVSEELRLAELSQARRAAALAKAEHASMAVSGEVLDLLYDVAMEKDVEATEVALAFAYVVLNAQAPVSVVGRTAGLLRGVYELTNMIELVGRTMMISTIAKSYATLEILESWDAEMKAITRDIEILHRVSKEFPV
jgi:hypothetical protein